MNFQFACGLFEMKPRFKVSHMSENVISFQKDHKQIGNSFWNKNYFEKKWVKQLARCFQNYFDF